MRRMCNIWVRNVTKVSSLPQSYDITSSTPGIFAFGSATIETFVNRSTFTSRMSPADALLYFILAAFVTNILTVIMMFGLPAFPRPIPSSATTPKPSSLSLDLSERGDSELQDSEVQDSELQDSEVQDSEIQDSEIQDSSPQPQVNGK